MRGGKAMSAPDGAQRVLIESLDSDGRGIGRVDGKTVFVEGALPAEQVEFKTLRRRPSYDVGMVHAVIDPSPSRVDPGCKHFGLCGGCSLQHLEARAQVATKQRVLEDALWHIGKVRPDRLLGAIHGAQWGYRRRARFTARWVEKKGGALVGFHEKGSSFVADMSSCEVLPTFVSHQIPVLRQLVTELSIRSRLPQVEVAIGDRHAVLVFRILDVLTVSDTALLKAFADASGFEVWVQTGGPESARPLFPDIQRDLSYYLGEFDVHIHFRPTDFTQINHDVNRLLVRRAMELLEPCSGEAIVDFFCGLGNFSLPIARSGARVTGVEGSAALVERARQNAVRNGLESRAEFEVGNLFVAETCAKFCGFDKALVDPPRDGAVELVKSFERTRPRRVVYVSCDPATLARDAGILVHSLGYKLSVAGVANMFPNTSHVESIAAFDLV